MNIWIIKICPPLLHGNLYKEPQNNSSCSFYYQRDRIIKSSLSNKFIIIETYLALDIFLLYTTDTLNADLTLAGLPSKCFLSFR